MHGRFVVACAETSQPIGLSTLYWTHEPEKPQRPIVHLKSPTVIKMRGKMIHREVVPRAGHTNATNGKAGLAAFDETSWTMRCSLSVDERAETNLLFLRGVCEAAKDMISTSFQGDISCAFPPLFVGDVVDL